ncbi:MAG: hypothetical protein P1U70_07530 [Saprospiraceae bacterium]|jgi:hypothetical protein|nr:hypothetical protein [Saprospiraceae bacterium]
MKKSHFFFLAIFIFSCTILLNHGCTLIGFGIGAAIDKSSEYKGAVTIPGWGSIEKLEPNSKIDVLKKDGTRFKGEYLESSFKWVENDSIPVIIIKGRGDYKGAKEILKLEEIAEVTVLKKGKAKQVGMLVGMGFDIVIIAGAISLANSSEDGEGWEWTTSSESESFSCPFIYSNSSNGFQLDAEVFGGSIFKAAQRTDLDNLEYLEPVNGKYNIQIRNELEEYQYVDEVKLVLVDHEKSAKVLPTFDGKIYSVNDTQKAIEANDKEGFEILNLISDKDSKQWVSYPFNRNSEKIEDGRDEINLTFEKPKNTSKATLVFNVQNTYWGSFLQKELLNMQGSNLDNWYAQLNSSSEARAELTKAMIREGMLLVKVWNGEKWQQRGFIWEVGPAISKDVALPIDLRGINTPDLKLKLEGPVGFWIINSVEIDYKSKEIKDFVQLSPESAVGHNNIDLKKNLATIDQNYYEMPTTEYWADLKFGVPPIEPNKERSILVKSRGYYKILVDPIGEPQTEIVNYMMKTPGVYGQFTLKKFEEYLQKGVSQLENQKTK